MVELLLLAALGMAEVLVHIHTLVGNLQKTSRHVGAVVGDTGQVRQHVGENKAHLDGASALTQTVDVLVKYTIKNCKFEACEEQEVKKWKKKSLMDIIYGE